MVVNSYRSDTCGSTCKDEIAYLQCEELANIRNYPVHRIDHLTCIALLYCIVIDIQMKIQILYISYHILRNECSHGSRMIKAFRYLPGQTQFFLFSLQVACSKINANSYFVIITMCKPLSNILP